MSSVASTPTHAAGGGRRSILFVQIPPTPVAQHGHGTAADQTRPRSSSSVSAVAAAYREKMRVTSIAKPTPPKKHNTKKGSSSAATIQEEHRSSSDDKLQQQQKQQRHQRENSFDPFNTFLKRAPLLSPSSIIGPLSQMISSSSSSDKELGFTAVFVLKRKAMLAKIRIAFANSPLINPTTVTPTCKPKNYLTETTTTTTTTDTQTQQPSQNDNNNHHTSSAYSSGFFPENFLPHLRSFALHPSIALITYPPHTLLSQQDAYPSLINIVLSGRVRMIRNGIVTVEGGVGEFIGGDTAVFGTQEYRQWRRSLRRQRLRKQQLALNDINNNTTISSRHHADEEYRDRMMELDEEELQLPLERQLRRKKRRMKFPQYQTIECMTHVECVVFPSSILKDYLSNDRGLRAHSYQWLMVLHWLKRQQYNEAEATMHRVWGAKRAADGEAYTDDKVLGSIGFLCNDLIPANTYREKELIARARQRQHHGGVDHPMFAYHGGELDRKRVKLKAEQRKNEKERKKEMQQKVEREEKVRKVRKVIDALDRNRKKKQREALKLKTVDLEDEDDDDEDDDEFESDSDSSDEEDDQDDPSHPINELYQQALQSTRTPAIHRHSFIITPSAKNEMMTPSANNNINNILTPSVFPSPHFRFSGPVLEQRSSEETTPTSSSSSSSPTITPTFTPSHQWAGHTPIAANRRDPARRGTGLTAISEHQPTSPVITNVTENKQEPAPYVDQPFFRNTSIAANTVKENDHATAAAANDNDVSAAESVGEPFIVGSTRRRGSTLSVVNYSVLKHQREIESEISDHIVDTEEAKEQLSAFTPLLEDLNPTGGNRGLSYANRPFTAPVICKLTERRPWEKSFPHKNAKINNGNGCTNHHHHHHHHNDSKRDASRPLLSPRGSAAITASSTPSLSSASLAASRPQTALGSSNPNNPRWANELKSSHFLSLVNTSADVIAKREGKSAAVVDHSIDTMMHLVSRSDIPWTTRLQLLQRVSEERYREEDHKQEMEKHMDRKRLEAALNAPLTTTRISVPVHSKTVNLWHERNKQHNKTIESSSSLHSRPQTASASMSSYVNNFAAHLHS